MLYDDQQASGKRFVGDVIWRHEGRGWVKKKVTLVIKRLTQDSKISVTRVPTPSGAQEKKFVRDIDETKMLSWLVVGVPKKNSVYKHAQEWSRTHVKDTVDMLEFGGLRKLEKTQHALHWPEGEMYFCSMDLNSRVVSS